MHNPAFPTRLYAVVPGKHAVVCGMEPTTSGQTLALRKNGDDTQIQWAGRGADVFRANGSWQVDLAIGEYVEVLVSSSAVASSKIGKGNTWAHMTSFAGSKGDPGAYVEGASSVEVWQTGTGTSYSNGVVKEIAWNNEVDPEGMHASGDSKLYATEPGKHVVVASMQPGGPGNHTLGLRKNGDNAQIQWAGEHTGGTRASGAWQVDLLVGEYVEVVIYGSVNSATVTGKVNTWAHMTTLTGPKGDKGDTGAIGPPSRRTIAGVVRNDGTKQVASAEYTVTKIGTGEYTVTFAVPFTSVPAVVCWPKRGFTASITKEDTTDVSITGFQLSVRNSIDGVLQNLGFHFVATATDAQGDQTVYEPTTQVALPSYVLNNAAPIQLPAGNDDRQVKWVRGDNGAMVADLWAHSRTDETAGNESGGLYGQAHSRGTGTARTELGAHWEDESAGDDDQQDETGAYMQMFASPTQRFVGARAGTQDVVIIKHDGTSDFRKNVFPTVTQLPSSPYDGQEVYLNDWAKMGDVIWHLRYTQWAAGTYKWLYMGGGFVYSRIASTIQTPVGGRNFNGPSLVAPATGIYDVSQMFNAFPGSNASLIQTDLVDGSNNFIDSASESFIQGWVSPSGPTRFQGARVAPLPVNLTVGQTIKIAFYGDQVVNVRFMALGLKPIAVTRVLV
jgi:hypothetical protein